MSVMSIPDSFRQFGWFCQDASKVCGICPELTHIWSQCFCFNLWSRVITSHESVSLFSWGRRAIVFEGAIKVPPAPVYPPSWRTNDPVQNLWTSAFRKMFPISKWFSPFLSCFHFCPCSFFSCWCMMHCPKWQLQIGSLLIQAWFPKFHQDNSGPVPCQGFVSDLWRWGACAMHWVFRMDFSPCLLTAFGEDCLICNLQQIVLAEKLWLKSCYWTVVTVDLLRRFLRLDVRMPVVWADSCFLCL